MASNEKPEELAPRDVTASEDRDQEDKEQNSSPSADSETPKEKLRPEESKPKWSLGMLRDKHTDEVPGSVLLLSKFSEHNAPLGLNNMPARTSSSSLPSVVSASSRSRAMFRRIAMVPEKKRTKDGKIILEPQPDDSINDPLNWSVLRRDAALLSLGFYCLIGGGMTTILAAGFTNVADTYNVSVPEVALTTGLYMMGLGLGSVVASPTAIAFGKRPVYLVASLLFALTSIWCALSPNYPSLVVARIIQGFAVSPVECLPSATIAEIFFLHERAYRLGVYTLLLLGGKNLVPLVSAAIIQSLGWRWVFWIVAIIVGFCFCLLFVFVPETFWDRTPRPHKTIRRPSLPSLRKITSPAATRTPKSPRTSKTDQPAKSGHSNPEEPEEFKEAAKAEQPEVAILGGIAARRQQRHAHFAATINGKDVEGEQVQTPGLPFDGSAATARQPDQSSGAMSLKLPPSMFGSPGYHTEAWRVEPQGGAPVTPELRNLNSPSYTRKTESVKEEDYFGLEPTNTLSDTNDLEASRSLSSPNPTSLNDVVTADWQVNSANQTNTPKTFRDTLKPYNGRMSHDNWFKVAFRPFILFAYPAILWSSTVYSLSVGWLIVLSESVSTIFRNSEYYEFSAIGAGLIYISPFIGGILGTVVAGKVSDIVVRFIADRNGGIYEPEFRLVMAIPVTISTVIGLMGYGWSAEVHDSFWAPTIFFGSISFGCTLGSTTAITFAVDSYRQYAGEALVTLNFSKNIFHGLVFSLFFNKWLDSDGSKDVFIALGGIQLFFLLFTIPMYIFGKRARMWTVRKNLMEKF